MIQRYRRLDLDPRSENVVVLEVKTSAGGPFGLVWLQKKGREQGGEEMV